MLLRPLGAEEMLLGDLTFFGRLLRWQPSEVMALPYSRRVKLRDMNLKIEEDTKERMKGGDGKWRNSSKPQSPRSAVSTEPDMRSYSIAPPTSSPPPSRRRNPRRPRGQK